MGGAAVDGDREVVGGGVALAVAHADPADIDRRDRRAARRSPSTGGSSSAPSSIIICAPPTVSSAGWKSSLTVPRELAPPFGQQTRGAEQDGGVHVVAAGVHLARQSASDRARPWRPGAAARRDRRAARTSGPGERRAIGAQHAGLGDAGAMRDARAPSSSRLKRARTVRCSSRPSSGCRWRSRRISIIQGRSRLRRRHFRRPATLSKRGQFAVSADIRFLEWFRRAGRMRTMPRTRWTTLCLVALTVGCERAPETALPPPRAAVDPSGDARHHARRRDRAGATGTRDAGLLGAGGARERVHAGLRDRAADAALARLDADRALSRRPRRARERRRLGAAWRALRGATTAAGYATAAFVSGFPLDRQFGLERGFEVYDDELGGGANGARVRRRPPTARWLDYWQPAVAGRSSSGCTTTIRTSRTAARAVRARVTPTPYLGEIAAMDAELGRLVAAYRDRESPAEQRRIVGARRSWRVARRARRDASTATCSTRR